jgi:hypothetical protein
VILYQQWVEEAQQDFNQTICAKDPAAQGYLDLLPCPFYSDHGTKLTKVVKPFGDVDLASHIL